VGRGIDLKVDLDRIARTAREIADFDVLCLQEVAVIFRVWRAAVAKTRSRNCRARCPVMPSITASPPTWMTATAAAAGSAI